MAGVLLGVDVGTTGVRGAIFDVAGAKIAEHVEACPPSTPRPGWAEADAAAWWRAFVAIAGRVVDRPGRVEAVGVVGQAPAVVAVDGDGRAIRPAMLWLDVRAEDEAREAARRLGRTEDEGFGGNRFHPYFLGP